LLRTGLALSLAEPKILRPEFILRQDEGASE
jgi:hypothetical protein